MLLADFILSFLEYLWSCVIASYSNTHACTQLPIQVHALYTLSMNCIKETSLVAITDFRHMNVPAVSYWTTLCRQDGKLHQYLQLHWQWHGEGRLWSLWFSDIFHERPVAFSECTHHHCLCTTWAAYTLPKPSGYSWLPHWYLEFWLIQGAFQYRLDTSAGSVLGCPTHIFSVQPLLGLGVHYWSCQGVSVLCGLLCWLSYTMDIRTWRSWVYVILYTSLCIVWGILLLLTIQYQVPQVYGVKFIVGSVCLPVQDETIFIEARAFFIVFVLSIITFVSSCV